MVPAEISIEHKLDKLSNRMRFFVSMLDEARTCVTSFPSIKRLCEFLDKHDYRYVWGSRGIWRLV